MTARPTLATLIARERSLISDLGSPPVFDDLTVQAALDQHRTEVRFAGLQPMPTFVAPSGGTVFLDYYAGPVGAAWEDGYVLQTMNWVDVTSSADVSEPLVGHWHFPTQPAGIGMRITGKVYDLYGAAADLLDQWAASLMLCVTFSTDQQKFQLSDQVGNILKVAARYRMLAAPRRIAVVQSDALGDAEGNSVVYPTQGWAV